MIFLPRILPSTFCRFFVNKDVTLRIQYFNRETNQLEVEKVYGDGAVRWLYQNPLGKGLSKILIKRAISKVYGGLQASSIFSKHKINPFIQDFSIKMEEYLPTEGRNESDPYNSFNEFFIRRFRPGMRPFAQDAIMPAPCEARYFAFQENTEQLQIPVKGSYLSPLALIGENPHAESFVSGPVIVARLCPVDYHRYHYPDEGEVLQSYRIPGVYHSVNPIALKEVPEVFMVNERQVSILQTKHFGKLAYIEVGAICVGKIVQSHTERRFNRGDEKGYFLFGGSTVIILGEPGKFKIDKDILDWSTKGTEVYLKLGERLAEV
jgi:phosphatidylserine decarboxylase